MLLAPGGQARTVVVEPHRLIEVRQLATVGELDAEAEPAWIARVGGLGAEWETELDPPLHIFVTVGTPTTADREASSGASRASSLGPSSSSKNPMVRTLTDRPRLDDPERKGCGPPTLPATLRA
jgi:hypothetical protein